MHDHNGVHMHDDGVYVNVSTPAARHEFILDTLREAASHMHSEDETWNCATYCLMMGFMAHTIGRAMNAKTDAQWNTAETLAKLVVDAETPNLNQLALLGEFARLHIAFRTGQPLASDVLEAIAPPKIASEG